MNALAQVEFKLAYFKAAVEHFNHYATATPTPRYFWMVDSLISCKWGRVFDWDKVTASVFKSPTFPSILMKFVYVCQFVNSCLDFQFFHIFRENYYGCSKLANDDRSNYCSFLSHISQLFDKFQILESGISLEQNQAFSTHSNDTINLSRLRHLVTWFMVCLPHTTGCILLPGSRPCNIIHITHSFGETADISWFE